MWIILLILVLLLAAVLLALLTFPARIGGDPAGARLARIQASPDFRDGRFHNLVPTDMRMPFTVMMKVIWTMTRGANGREPMEVIPTVPFDRAAWERIPLNEYAIAWLGHSSLLIKLDGITFLTDPVFGERASTFTFAGPKRFAYSEHMRVDLLPPVDVVLLSHDHYDHLCYETMREMARAGTCRTFIAALGVGAHLEKWGIPSASITELEWWQEHTVGPVKLTFAPARHFTGRGLSNRFSTLWGSFLLQGKSRRLYFGADSGYAPTFKEIGERFGPFDLAMLECGAYSEYWPNIHMFPEETAQAALDLRARVLMPIHWGKFALGLHPWKESIERLLPKAAELGLPVFTPRIGRIVATPDPTAGERWWEEVR